MQAAFDDRPFAQLLQEQGLPPGLQQVLLHAVAMADRAQPGIPSGNAPNSQPSRSDPQPAAQQQQQQQQQQPHTRQQAGQAASAEQDTAVSDLTARQGFSAERDTLEAGQSAAQRGASREQPGQVLTAERALEALSLYMRSAGRYALLVFCTPNGVCSAN